MAIDSSDWGSQNNLAIVLKDLGDYEGAKGLLDKAVASPEKNLGPDHPTTAVRYSNLALVLMNVKKISIMIGKWF